MRGLEIIVLVIIALFALIGYYRGFLRVAYSIVAWVIVFAFVTFAAPYLTEVLEKSTGLKDAIQEKCVVYIESMAEERIAQEAEEYGGGQGSAVSDRILEEIMGSAASAVGGILESSGIYDEMAGQAAHFIIEGISFFAAMLIVGIFTFWLSHMLNLVSRIPVIQGPNKVLGAIAGGLKGLVIVWLLFYFIRLCATSEWGMQCLDYIEGSPFLKLLYDNNILLLFLLKLLKK